MCANLTRTTNKKLNSSILLLSIASDKNGSKNTLPQRIMRFFRGPFRVFCALCMVYPSRLGRRQWLGFFLGRDQTGQYIFFLRNCLRFVWWLCCVRGKKYDEGQFCGLGVEWRAFGGCFALPALSNDKNKWVPYISPPRQFAPQAKFPKSVK